MNIRFANEADLPGVNRLRKQVNDLHVAGRPETFKPGFAPELENHVYTVWNDPDQDILVAEEAGVILGFAILHEIRRPENPFMFERHFLDIDEFGGGRSRPAAGNRQSPDRPGQGCGEGAGL